jgi:undecaprenyl pyrophosphate phosphatase UppP
MSPALKAFVNQTGFKSTVQELTKLHLTEFLPLPSTNALILVTESVLEKILQYKASFCKFVFIVTLCSNVTLAFDEFSQEVTKESKDKNTRIDIMEVFLKNLISFILYIYI